MILCHNICVTIHVYLDKIDPYLSAKGIKTFKNVIDGEGNNRKREYMSDKYQLKPVDILSWDGLLNSTPKQWKKKLQHHYIFIYLYIYILYII